MKTLSLNAQMRRLFLLCWMAYSVSYIARYDFSACLNGMVQDGIFDRAGSGAVSTAFFACYGAGQLINGFLGEKIRPQLMIFTGLAGAGLSNIIMSFTVPGLMPVITWGVNGYFCSMLWAAVIRCFAGCMTETARAKAGVNISSTIPAGTVASYLLSALMLKVSGWRAAFLVSGAAVLVCAVVWALGCASLRSLFGRESGKETNVALSAVRNDIRRPGFLPLLLSTGAVFTVAAILFNGILKDGVTVWIPSFLETGFDVDASVAAASSVVLPIVNLAGAYVASALDRRVFHNEMVTGAVMFAVSLVSSLLLCTVGGSSMLLTLVLFAVITSSMLGANTMFLTFIPLRFGKLGRASSMSGFLDACSYGASAVSTAVTGTITQGGWTPALIGWTAVAATGAVISAVGAPFWKKGRKRLEDSF